MLGKTAKVDDSFGKLKKLLFIDLVSILWNIFFGLVCIFSDEENFL
jgi:hypothetical protein